MIDTGASPNVLDIKVYESFDKLTRPKLQGTDTNIQAAEGSTLRVYGQTLLKVDIGSKIFPVKFVVAELDDLQCILGMDFLSNNSCVIDTSNGEMNIGSRRILLKRKTCNECSCITLAKRIIIPGNTEQIIRCSIDNPKLHLEKSEGFAEADDSFSVQTGLGVPDSVVRIEKSEILIKIINFGSEPVTLEKGVSVGTLRQIVKVSSLKTNRRREYQSKTLADLPEHLREMASQSMTNVPPVMQSVVCGMIFDNQDVFLKPGDKLGRTHLVKHSIDTQEAKPVKRRAYKPAVCQKFIIEKQIEEMLEGDQIVPIGSPWAATVVLVTKKDVFVWTIVG